MNAKDAFEDLVSKYDLDEDEWQDMGSDELFTKGFEYGVETCAQYFDKLSEEMKNEWDKFIEEKFDLPATSYHTVMAAYAEKLRGLKQ